MTLLLLHWFPVKFVTSPVSLLETVKAAGPRRRDSTNCGAVELWSCFFFVGVFERACNSQFCNSVLSARSMDTVVVTRHGARIDNGPDADRDWLSKAGHDRRADPHLSPCGKVAAEELASALAAAEVQLTHIISSPYVRCIETADAVARRLKLDIKVEPGISEVGTSYHKLLPFDELAASFPRIATTYEPVLPHSEIGPENSDGQAARRASATALEVRERLSGALLFVGHGASCLGLVSAFGVSGYVGYTSISHFYRESTGKWVLQGELGDVDHLSDKTTARRSAW